MVRDVDVTWRCAKTCQMNLKAYVDNAALGVGRRELGTLASVRPADEVGVIVPGGVGSVDDAVPASDVSAVWARFPQMARLRWWHGPGGRGLGDALVSVRPSVDGGTGAVLPGGKGGVDDAMPAS